MARIRPLLCTFSGVTNSTIKKKKTTKLSRKQRVRQEKLVEKGIATADVLVTKFEKNGDRIAKKLRWKKIY